MNKLAPYGLESGEVPDDIEGSHWYEFGWFSCQEEVDRHKLWLAKCLAIDESSILIIPYIRDPRRRYYRYANNYAVYIRSNFVTTLV